MRILGLDFGSRTCGVAVSDPLGMTAQGLETIVRKEENKLRRTLARIGDLAGEYGAERIVLGMPLHMDGSMGERAEKTLLFKEQLERRLGLPVVLEDERLSTVEAEEVLIEAGVRREHRKQYVDKLAAVLILQRYLDGIPCEK